MGEFCTTSHRRLYLCNFLGQGRHNMRGELHDLAQASLLLWARPPAGPTMITNKKLLPQPMVEVNHGPCHVVTYQVTTYHYPAAGCTLSP